MGLLVSLGLGSRKVSNDSSEERLVSEITFLDLLFAFALIGDVESLVLFGTTSESVLED